MEVTVLPFPIALLTAALVYRFLTPLLTGGKVALKPGIKHKYILFSLAAAAAFAVLYAVFGISLALFLAQYLKDYDVENETKWFWMSIVFRLVISQLIFFVFTLLAGKFAKGTIKVEGIFNAWKAAWAPAIVVVSLISLISYLYNLMFPAQ